MRQHFKCDVNRFEPVFNGILTISNVNVEEYVQFPQEGRAEDPDILEMRLGFD